MLRPSRRSFAADSATWALVLAAALCLAGSFQHGLWTPDEPREAEVAREMLESGFSAMPTLGREPFLEKPPLFAWIAAASYALFGVSAGAARLPAVLFSIGSVLVAYRMGRLAAGRLAGLGAALVLATMWQFAETSHKAVLDTALTFFVAAGHLAFLRLLTRGGWTPYAAIGAFSGLAFLTKGVIGPALLCAPPILAAAALRRWDFVKRVLPRAFVAAVAGVALFGLPWVLALAHTPGGGWEAVKTCLWTNTIGRSLGGGTEEFGFAGHSRWFGYYLVAFVTATAPWALVLPAAWKGGTLSRSWRGGRVAFSSLIFVAGLVFLSLPSGKRELYLVPLLPAAAVLPGAWLSRIGSRRGGAWDVVSARIVHALAWIVLVVLAIAFLLEGSGLLARATQELREKFGLDALDVKRGSFLVWGVAFAAAAFALRPRWRGRPAAWAGLQAATALVALHLGLQLGFWPLQDPFRDMADGAREIAASVPADEKLLAWSADETIVAVVPFHSGRILENVPHGRAEEVVRALDAGVARHLVVPAKEAKRLPPPLARRLTLEKTVRLSATRDLNLYSAKP